MSVATSTDRIKKTIDLKASRTTVWKALTNAAQFGAWFGVTFDGEFRAGHPLTGQLTIRNYDHLTMTFTPVTIEPEHYFSYRWHPYAIDTNYDYSQEIPTLVEFRLADHPGGVRLTVIESGFDRIPVARRGEAFRMNNSGWTSQIKNIERYVSGA